MQQKIVLPAINRPLTQQDLESLLKSAQNGSAVTVSLPFMGSDQHEFTLSASVVFGSNNAAKWYLFDGERTGGSMLWTTTTAHVELVLNKVLEVINKHREQKRSQTGDQSKRAPTKKIDLPAPAVFNAQAYAQCLTANTDATTGLFSEGCLFWFLGLEFERYQRYKQPFSLLLIAIYRDLGLPILDIGQKVKGAIRSIDMACIYQGSFALILPHSDTEDAKLCAERISKMLAEGSGLGAQAFSIGIATIPNHCEHLGVLVSAAVQASEMARLNDKLFMAFGE
jgi:hypothetical protein